MSSQLLAPADAPLKASKLSARVESVGDILGAMKLVIPTYQRPYTWSVKNVAELVGDIRRFRRAGQYRIGTFILNKPVQTEVNGTIAVGSRDDLSLDIVDGQQRYLSFALIAHALLTRTEVMSDHLAAELRTCSVGVTIPQRKDGRTDQNLRDNYQHVVQLISRWGEEELDDFTEFFLRDCTVVVLQVDDLDAAFQMFDSQNTRGRPLYPTDLLKAYHLREFSRTGPSRELVLETVRTWEAIPPEEINHVIAAVLFPIKRWSANHGIPGGGFSAEHVDLFKGIRQDGHRLGNYRWAHPVLLAKATVDRFRLENSTLLGHGVIEELKFPFEITQPVIDGEMFFHMMNHYIGQARRARIHGSLASPAKDMGEHYEAGLDEVMGILNAQPSGTGNRYIRELFDCLLMAYVDRFGWHEIRIASRVLAQHAYLLRVYLQRVQVSSVDIHARGRHDRVRDVEENFFAEISIALDPDVILARPSPRFERGTIIPEALRNLYCTEIDPAQNEELQP